jgi:hypothetical protein
MTFTRKDLDMTNNDESKGKDEAAGARWVDEMREAFDRTGDAFRTAWEATRESRLSALESAKQAAQELGDVIDQGMAAAKERWVMAERAGGERPDPETTADMGATPETASPDDVPDQTSTDLV